MHRWQSKMKSLLEIEKERKTHQIREILISCDDIVALFIKDIHIDILMNN